MKDKKIPNFRTKIKYVIDDNSKSKGRTAQFDIRIERG